MKEIHWKAGRGSPGSTGSFIKKLSFALILEQVQVSGFCVLRLCIHLQVAYAPSDTWPLLDSHCQHRNGPLACALVRRCKARGARRCRGRCYASFCGAASVPKLDDAARFVFVAPCRPVHHIQANFKEQAQDEVRCLYSLCSPPHYLKRKRGKKYVWMTTALKKERRFFFYGQKINRQLYGALLNSSESLIRIVQSVLVISTAAGRIDHPVQTS